MNEQVEEILWKMHKIIYPGEYGLGTEPESYNNGERCDQCSQKNDKEAWVQMGKLLDELLKM